MPFWRRRRDPWPVAAPPSPPVAAPPPDAAGIADRLAGCGVTPGALERLGDAGPVPVWAWEEDGAAAVGRWRELRAVHDRTGLWPVLLGPREDLMETFSFAGGDHDGQALTEGLQCSPTEVLARLAAGAASDDGPLHERPRLPTRLDVLPEQFAVAEQSTLLALVPAAAGWEVPAALSWEGAANLDMPPADHVAVLRRWHEQHGAELVALTSDTVELAVARPPITSREVVSTGRELYAYCPDVVDQGVGTLEALCREQVPRRSWSFWWD